MNKQTVERTLGVTILLLALGLVASIAVPNLVTARNRSRQKRTMADMRTIATAWEARATDTNSYSVVDEASLRIRTGSALPGERRVTTKQVAHSLSPTYVRKLPDTDGWDGQFVFSTGSYNKLGQADGYTIVSLGSDREPDRIAHASATTLKFTDDIIYSNGSFTQYPEDDG